MPESRLNDRVIVPTFHLPSRDHNVFDSSDLKRKKNLVLFFLTQPDSDFFLKAEEAYRVIKQENAELAVVCPLSIDQIEVFYRKNRLSFSILADEDGGVFSKFISSEKGEPVAALFIMDKFAEVFFHYVEKDAGLLPPFEDIIRSLNFIESQCPECQGGF